MADTFGNYIAAFLMAGGVGVIGSLIPFSLICVKRQSAQNFDNNIEGIMDQGESEHINEHELNPSSCSLDMIRKEHQRSSSFTASMESPLFC